MAMIMSGFGTERRVNYFRNGNAGHPLRAADDRLDSALALSRFSFRSIA